MNVGFIITYMQHALSTNFSKGEMYDERANEKQTTAKEIKTNT